MRVVRFGPEVSERKEVTVDLLAIRLAQTVGRHALASVTLQVPDGTLCLYVSAQNRDRPGWRGAMLIPSRRFCPLRVGVNAVAPERLNPLGSLVAIEFSVAVGIVVEHRTGVMADDVLDDLDPVLVCQRNKVLVVLHTAIARIRVVAFAVERPARNKMRIDVQEVLRPVAVVTGFGHVARVGSGIPHVPDWWSDPERGHAEIVEITAAQCQFEAAEIPAVVSVDVGLCPVVERTITAGGDVVLPVTVVKTIREGEIDHVLIPRKRCRGISPHEKRQPAKERGEQQQGWSHAASETLFSFRQPARPDRHFARRPRRLPGCPLAARSLDAERHCHVTMSSDPARMLLPLVPHLPSGPIEAHVTPSGGMPG